MYEARPNFPHPVQSQTAAPQNASLSVSGCGSLPHTNAFRRAEKPVMRSFSQETTRTKMKSMALLLAAAVVAAAMAAAAAQAPSCASKLIPCAPYLNSTAKPPDTCCGPMKEAVEKEKPCLCSLLNNTALLKSFNIEIDQVLRLPKACGLSADTSICSTNSTPAVSPASSTAHPPPPPATPPATKTTNSAPGVAWIGMSGFVSLLFFWWSIVV